MLPSDVTTTGCVDQTFTTDTPLTSVSCLADDGSSSVGVTVRIKVDKTPPIVTGSQPARGADANGWYNHAVGVSFAGSDLTSGVASCTSTTYGGPDSASASVQGTCIDHAGNVSAPVGYGLKYDETAPAVTAARPERQPNADGWFNRAVSFDIDGTDAISGIAGCAPVTYGGPDSATATITGVCQDQAGNATNRSFALKYDSTPPTVAGSQAARPADAGGWYNHPVAVSFTGADGLSGVEACTATTYSGPDAGTASVPGTCTDRAGNVSPSVAFGLRYDATKPLVTRGQPGRVADADGWYNHAVDVAFSGTDQTAGIAGCETLTYAGPDSGTASLGGTCSDHAGNQSNPLSYQLKYDATAPAVAGADPERAANANGWFNRSVAFTIRGTDATSGLAACPGTTYSGPDSATASVTGVCRDRAGNSASRAFTLKYDATAPTASTGVPTRAADKDGWFNHPVAVAFSGTDGLSGVDSCSSATYGGPDSATASVSGTCTDDAGNVSTPLGHALKYDATAPTVTGGEPGRAPNADGWYTSAVAIGFAGTDPVSGVDLCTSTSYGGPDNVAASVSGTCTDKAGNTSGSFPFGLKYDATAPAVTAADPDRAANANGWYNRAVGFTVRGTDATSGVAACPATTYSGPDNATASVTGTCRDRAGNSAGRDFALKYDATPPAATGGQPARLPDVGDWYNRAVAIAFTGTDQLSGLDTCATVTYAGPDSATASAPGTCTDKAGNVSAPLGRALRYDATGPTVTGGHLARDANANGWYRQAVDIAFAGTDPVSGVQGCTRATYSGPDSATASVGGTCTDNAGNRSASFPVGLKYDGTAPEVTARAPDRSPDAGDWYNRAVTYTFVGTDATSGVETCPAVTYSAPDSAEASVVAHCTDRAGNTADRAFPLKFDATGPAVTAVTPDRQPNGAGWYNRPVTLRFGGTDPVSGLGSCTETTYAGPDNATTSVPGTCTDAAGNVSATHTHALKYDATAPEVTRPDPDRPPNDDDWYNRAVSIAFLGTDQTSGVDECVTTTYAGPDTAGTSVPGTCRDKAGNLSGTLNFDLKYDGTPPVVTGATPDRDPNAAGWFVSPVEYQVTGTDALSGIDVCPRKPYSGPDGAGATVFVSCFDQAGNSATRGFLLNYDATAPLLTSVVAAGGDRSVSLSWQTSPDAVSIEVWRTPGIDGQPRSRVYDGTGTSFVDRRVDNGVRYEYELDVLDAAGNARTHSVVGLPAAPAALVPSGAPTQPPAVVPQTQPSILPASGTVLRAGASPLLQWPRVDSAGYYNLQLYRGSRKILSAWPKRAQYRLKARWTYRGERRRLGPGRYRWMVWPGYGKRSKANFGKRIVSSTFQVKRGGAAGT